MVREKIVENTEKIGTEIDFLMNRPHWNDIRIPRNSILETLNQRLSVDMTYESGKIFGAMTQPGHEFAKEVYSIYNNRNLGDSGLVPGTEKIEHDTIGMLGSLLGDDSVRGNIVSGGTEANLIGMMLAKFQQPETSNPEVVISEAGHYSFDKAAQLMGLKLKKARLLDDFSLDFDHFKSLISENTIALVGIAGTTALGLLDPISKIGDIARQKHVYLHVDGAFGGLVFPFLSQLGHSLTAFDFEVPSINSYTVDPHKFGMGVNPTGAILVRGATREEEGFNIPYLAGGGQSSFNLLGTRPGASAISFWALMHYLGKEGFKDEVARCWENTLYLKEEITRIPRIDIAVDPISPVLGIKPTTYSPKTLTRLDFYLRSKGWALGVFQKWNLLRSVVMPHITRTHIDTFIRDLRLFGG